MKRSLAMPVGYLPSQQNCPFFVYSIPTAPVINETIEEMRCFSQFLFTFKYPFLSVRAICIILFSAYGDWAPSLSEDLKSPVRDQSLLQAPLAKRNVLPNPSKCTGK